MGGLMHLSELPSATPQSPVRSARRLDPYWDGVWQHGATAQWSSRELIERVERAGLAGKRPRELRTTPQSAAARIDEDWDAKLNLLGVLSAWRTVTSEQAAAFTGSRLAGAHGRAIGDLFALDIIDTGALSAATTGAAASRGRLYRPSSGSAFDDMLLDRLTYAEWLSVTGGLKWLTGGQYDRHNVLTSELALRCAEHLPIGTVLGERQARVNTLAFTAVGDPEPPGRSQQAADAVIVRSDGLRIAVETTASAGGQGLARKAEMWARVLERQPQDDCGLVVVFVVADRAGSDPTNHGRGSLLWSTRKAVAKAARLHPGAAGNRTAMRMYVVEWRDWFPARHEASADFLTLRARRPTGTGDSRDVWMVADLLDEFDVPTPEHMDDPTAVIRNASGLRAVPPHLKVSGRPQVFPITVRQAGFAGVPAVSVDPRTGEVRNEDLAGITRARGAAGTITVPPRLVY